MNEVLNQKYGKKGTESRRIFDEESESYYHSVILKERRKKLGMTQEALAKKVGKKRPYISRVENGEDIKMSNLVTIANALGLYVELRPNL